ncbi:MAG TPA: TetR/AcrR family transcriptional regulator [Ktedonobacteraceae bacterium]
MTEAPLSERPRRPYHSLARERQAEESRQRILDAARSLFLKRGYAGTTVDAIAEGAGLSPKTVTAVFGSKLGVLTDLLRPSTFGQRYQQLLERLQTEPDPVQRVALTASITCQVYDALAPELDLLRGAASIAPELTELARQVEARRRENQGRLITYLVNRGVLHQGLQPEEATDELWALSSYDLYRMLVVERGWASERYEAWLANVLLQRLLDPQSYPPL